MSKVRPLPSHFLLPLLLLHPHSHPHAGPVPPRVQARRRRRWWYVFRSLFLSLAARAPARVSMFARPIVRPRTSWHKSHGHACTVHAIACARARARVASSCSLAARAMPRTRNGRFAPPPSPAQAAARTVRLAPQRIPQRRLIHLADGARRVVTLGTHARPPHNHGACMTVPASCKWGQSADLSAQVSASRPSPSSSSSPT